MQQQGGFAGRRRALERGGGYTDDGAALREGGENFAQALGTGKGVKLIAAFHEPWGCGQIIVDAKCDDQDIGFVGSVVCRNAPGGWISNLPAGRFYGHIFARRRCPRRNARGRRDVHTTVSSSRAEAAEVYPQRA